MAKRKARKQGIRLTKFEEDKLRHFAVEHGTKGGAWKRIQTALNRMAVDLKRPARTIPVLQQAYLRLKRKERAAGAPRLTHGTGHVPQSFGGALVAEIRGVLRERDRWRRKAEQLQRTVASLRAENRRLARQFIAGLLRRLALPKRARRS